MGLATEHPIKRKQFIISGLLIMFIGEISTKDQEDQEFQNTTLLNFLFAFSDEDCSKQKCMAFQTEDRKLNFLNLVDNLKLVLDDLSNETIHSRLKTKGHGWLAKLGSADHLFHFLISNPSDLEISQYIEDALAINPTSHGHPHMKRDVADTMADIGSWLKEKFSNVDWWEVGKRATQLYNIVQSVRGVTDPSQFVLNTGFALGKAVLQEVAQDKISSWFKG